MYAVMGGSGMQMLLVHRPRLARSAVLPPLRLPRFVRRPLVANILDEWYVHASNVT